MDLLNSAPVVIYNNKIKYFKYIWSKSAREFNSRYHNLAQLIETARKNQLTVRIRKTS